ncbi:hypothetical protein AAL_07556 [Moelleriella libera RCEF 2490]|uniref:Uncharacterized protein n=1 Tax=Moelleriella libera RCEF 2490 TaxID=1081109 RepID=A0A162I7I7_9HYPO|nr:hypothetical protein AAL_07556 [Moelleriella libera RCEF 2490]
MSLFTCFADGRCEESGKPTRIWRHAAGKTSEVRNLALRQGGADVFPLMHHLDPRRNSSRNFTRRLLLECIELPAAQTVGSVEGSK